MRPRRPLKSRRNYADEYAMPRLLRPREEFPTPAFRAFLVLLAAAGAALFVRWLVP